MKFITDFTSAVVFLFVSNLYHLLIDKNNYNTHNGRYMQNTPLHLHTTKTKHAHISLYYAYTSAIQSNYILLKIAQAHFNMRTDLRNKT